MARIVSSLYDATHMINLNQQWLQFYKVALIELSHAKMTGRIAQARTAISARLEELPGIPNLHEHEHEAITDALRSLKFLEGEEERYPGR